MPRKKTTKSKKKYESGGFSLAKFFAPKVGVGTKYQQNPTARKRLAEMKARKIAKQTGKPIAQVHEEEVRKYKATPEGTASTRGRQVKEAEKKLAKKPTTKPVTKPTTKPVTKPTTKPVVPKKPTAASLRMPKLKSTIAAKDRKNTLAAARKAGHLYYYKKDGTKMAAVTKEMLNKSGHKSLRDFMNAQLGKTRRKK